ncbi:hypothetical protein BGZ61DRAFT_368260, partial [Ilyonectria robusta]|uniref:uncharacterized protein n=1 Tax=Ilyonectria robusta TaxID=1079257 RepID=UPI001E8E5A87
VCLEQLLDKDDVRFLPCRHVFHASCINRWFLEGKQTYPFCKSVYPLPLPALRNGGAKYNVNGMEDVG